MTHRVQVAVLLAFCCGSACADPGDEICFPIYREAGAVPLASACELDAATANFGMGSYFCGNPDPIHRYCGAVLKPARCERSTNADVGHPIDTSTGNKHLTERDFTGTGGLPLVLERYYNSSPLAYTGGAFGDAWRSNFDMRVFNPTTTTVQAVRMDGAIVYYTNASGVWTADTDMMDVLAQQKDGAGTTIGWTLRNAEDDSVETYNANGRLVSVTARSGQKLTITRSTSATPSNTAPAAGYIIAVSDHFGRSLSFTWTSAGNVNTITDPNGEVIRYQYDGGLLRSVNYPAATAPQPTRQYVYNESAYTGGASLPNALTGIIDENDNRLAIYRYDARGRGIGTEYAGGADKYNITYSTNSATIVDPLLSSRVYRFKTVLGAARLSGISQPGGAGCAAASNSINYDAHANVADRTDFTGVKTVYTYDLTRNLETARTEAHGTPAARVISTSWHPTMRLPARIAEPKLLTTYTYDAKRNLLTRTLQATTDPTGAQGFAAAADGAARTWTYTYNSAGQLLTETGPRTDVVDRITYDYDAASGNLLKMSDQMGLVTTFDSYDAVGRLTKLTRPNGSSQEFSYSSRGWLLNSTLHAADASASEQTTYTYTPSGQVKTVTTPDGRVMTNSYDDAQRLVGVSDSLGNTVSYVLDKLGNRTSESIRDPAGVLTRQISRTYDALSRLQKQTGVVQ